jgi:hypothetical protein
MMMREPALRENEHTYSSAAVTKNHQPHSLVIPVQHPVQEKVQAESGTFT